MIYIDPARDAYLDIETTGLSLLDAEIIVVGLYLVNETRDKIVQLVGEDIARENLLNALKVVKHIFTYNGSHYDLPFINEALGIDLETMFDHHDLMNDCWKCNLRGGLKAVEKQLGIPRYLQPSGSNIIKSWQQYQQDGDQEALTLLLGYNKEDLINFKLIKEKLDGKLEP